MTMQATRVEELETGDDAAEEWLIQNAGLCRRYQVNLTRRACEKIRRRSENAEGLRWIDDFQRCIGCGGLDYQPDPITPCEPKPLRSEPSPAEPEILPPNRQIDEDSLDEILAELFPEEVEGEDDLPRPVRVKAKRLKRGLMIYAGRCRRCGGYMSGDLEGQFDRRDEEVCRCLNCGWRTSPQYEWNRSRRDNIAQGRN